MAFRNPRPLIRKAKETRHKVPRIARGKRALVRKSNLQLGKLKPGDMVLVSTRGSAISSLVNKSLDSRYSHVAVYMGDGLYIHARGKVGINSMDENHPLYEDYLKSLFVKVQRII